MSIKIKFKISGILNYIKPILLVIFGYSFKNCIYNMKRP